MHYTVYNIISFESSLNWWRWWYHSTLKIEKSIIRINWYFFLTVLRVSIIERISQNCNFFHILKQQRNVENVSTHNYVYIKLTTIYCSIHRSPKKVLFFSCKMWTDIWMFTRKYSAIKKVVAKSSFIHSHVETVTKKNRTCI